MGASLTCFRVIAGRGSLRRVPIYNALSGKARSMSCQVVMHRHHHDHYHQHQHNRYNQDYVAHQHRHEPSEEEERLPGFDANRRREKSGTGTKEQDFSSSSPPMELNAAGTSPAAASPYPNPSYSTSFDHQSIMQPHQQHYYHPQEQPLEANVSKSNTKESHNGSSGGSSPSEAQQQQQQPHRKRRATAEDLSQEQLPFTRVPAIARSETETEGEEEGNAQYLTANCLLLTYFNGDAANLVDAHFDRALNCDKTSPSVKQRDSSDPPLSLPLSQRNFPASFWNSDYQSLSSSSEVASAASSLASIAGQPAHPHEFYTSDPYAGAAPGSGMVDPWQNYMAAAASGHAAYYSAGAAAAAAGRLNQYHHHPSTAFLLQRQGRSSTSSSSSAAAASSSAAAAAAAAVEGYGAAAAYSAMTGLEGSMHQGTSKDLYWF